MPTIFLNPGKERPVQQRHPWVFSGAVARVQAGRTVAPVPSQPAPSDPSGAYAEEFWVPHKSELVRIAAADIDRVDAERDYMRLHVGSQSYLLHQTISSLEERLDTGSAAGLDGAIARAYVNERRDPAFEAVKYRRCLHALAAHLHVAPRGEHADFLFHGPRARRYETPIFESFRRAHYAAEALYDLPFSIAEGLARKHRVPRETFLARIAPRLSAGERLRLQQSSRRALGEAVAVDLGAAPPTRLASYLLGLPMKERLARREELRLALDHAAHRAARRHGERYGKVAAVLERVEGGDERRE